MWLMIEVQLRGDQHGLAKPSIYDLKGYKYASKWVDFSLVSEISLEELFSICDVLRKS